MKKILILLLATTFFSSYVEAQASDCSKVYFANNYFITLSLSGEQMNNQHVKYMVKDGQGNIVVSQQFIYDGSATLAWQSNYLATTSKLKDNKYTIYIFNLEAKNTAIDSTSHYISYALPITITEHSDYLRCAINTNYYGNTGGLATNPLYTMYGSFAINYMSSEIFNQQGSGFVINATDDPSAMWQQITSVKSLISDPDNTKNSFPVAYNSDEHGIGVTYLPHQLNIDIKVPYVTDHFISTKNLLSPYSNSLGYNFAPRL